MIIVEEQTMVNSNNRHKCILGYYLPYLLEKSFVKIYRKIVEENER